MSQAPAIGHDLMLLLRREALSDYSLACGEAQVAAELCACGADGSTADDLTDLRACRARVVAAGEALDAVGDDVATPEAWDIPLDDRSRDVVAIRMHLALDRVSRDLESSEPEILEAARRIEHLHAVLAKWRR